MFKFTTTLFSKREVWLNRIKGEAIVKNEILYNSKPTVAKITAALGLPEGVITEKLLSICENVKTIELGLPVPNSENVIAFSTQVGPENSTKKVAGCYYIYSPSNPELGTYVGHSIHLGKRVKDHAKALQSYTGKLAQTAGSNAVVRVYIPDPSQLPATISMALFVLILERRRLYSTYLNQLSIVLLLPHLVIVIQIWIIQNTLRKWEKIFTLPTAV